MRTLFARLSLALAVVSSIATSSSSTGPVWVETDDHADPPTYVDGEHSTTWLTNVGALARDFWNTDTLVVTATPLSTGPGTLTLEVTAAGETESHTVPLTGATATVTLHDLVPDCTNWDWGCHNLVGVRVFTDSGVQVDLSGDFVVEGDSPGAALAAPLVELFAP